MSKKICLTELKKIIKDYSAEFDRFSAEDNANCQAVVCIDKEKQMLKDNNYSFYDNLTKMTNLSEKIAKYTNILNKANAVTALNSETFVGTISEALAKMKYANKMIFSLEKKLINTKTTTYLNYDKQICRTIYFYDMDVVKKELNNFKEFVRILQLDIDRTNLSTFVEID